MTGRIAILAPSPVLTVTIEADDEQGSEIHYHAGGQGVWVARMAGLLGAEIILCVALAGEAGEILRGLLPAGKIEVRAVTATGAAAPTSTTGEAASGSPSLPPTVRGCGVTRPTSSTALPSPPASTPT